MTDGRFLGCDYFAGAVDVIARDLIGRTLTMNGNEHRRSGIIVETEAYGGLDDPASHAAFRPGGRAAIMFGRPGHVYVYAAYGMHPCFNIVTGAEGEPAAVLVRGIWLNGDSSAIHGPGRVTRALGIALDDHGSLACGGRFTISVARESFTINVTRRIGITRETDRPWRFVGLNAREAIA